jgi:hypothetical protein
MLFLKPYLETYEWVEKKLQKLERKRVGAGLFLMVMTIVMGPGAELNTFQVGHLKLDPFSP